MADVPFAGNLKKPIDGSPLFESKAALDVRAHMFAETVASDAAEANSTTKKIIATAHSARRGDIIRFTSGNLDQLEVSVASVDTNEINLVEVLSEAPAVADTFDILRPRTPLISNLGGAVVTSAQTAFIRDSVVTDVEEDTGTPANNRPLPTKLTGPNGDLGIYVEDAASTGGETGILPLAVRNSTGATTTNADGDYGTFTIDDTGRLRVDATVTEAATAADGDPAPALSKVVAGVDGAGDTQTLSVDTNGRSNVNVVDPLPAGTNNIGDVDVLTEPATSADAAAGLPAVSKVIAGYDGTNIRTMHTDSAGDVQVDLASSIPAGTNNIGDVDVLTEPATSADAAAGLPAVSKVIAGYDGANVRTIHTDTAGDIQVDLASALPAGTNNIGDVDVLTEPATVADGGALPAVVKAVAGYDGSNVQVLSTNSSGYLNTLDQSSIVPFAFDYIEAAYPSGTVEEYTYKTGGSGGTTVATVTVTYTDATKALVDTIERT